MKFSFCVLIALAMIHTILSDDSPEVSSADESKQNNAKRDTRYHINLMLDSNAHLAKLNRVDPRKLSSLEEEMLGKKEDQNSSPSEYQNSDSQKDQNSDLQEDQSSDSRKETQVVSETFRENIWKQQEICERILQSKDYYEVLGVTKTATDSQIKSAYRKLVFIVHPDRSRAPSATKAFAALGTAYGILSDLEKRKIYDLQEDESNRQYPPIRFDSSVTIDPPTTLDEVMNNLKAQIFKPIIHCVLGGIHDAKVKTNLTETFDSIAGYFAETSTNINKHAQSLKVGLSTKENFDATMDTTIKQLSSKLEKSLGDLATNQSDAFLRSINSCFTT